MECFRTNAEHWRRRQRRRRRCRQAPMKNYFRHAQRKWMLFANEVIKRKTFAMADSSLNDLYGTSCATCMRCALIHRPRATEWKITPSRQDDDHGHISNSSNHLLNAKFIAFSEPFCAGGKCIRDCVASTERNGKKSGRAFHVQTDNGNATMISDCSCASILTPLCIHNIKVKKQLSILQIYILRCSDARKAAAAATSNPCSEYMQIETEEDSTSISFPQNSIQNSSTPAN